MIKPEDKMHCKKGDKVKYGDLTGKVGLVHKDFIEVLFEETDETDSAIALFDHDGYMQPKGMLQGLPRLVKLN
jgi:hypothetical protein